MWALYWVSLGEEVHENHRPDQFYLLFLQLLRLRLVMKFVMVTMVNAQ